MTRVSLIACLLGAVAASAPAQDQVPVVDTAAAAFIPPQAYPMDRYESTWSKNPFTLKTAPAAVETISFAKDLALISHFGEKSNPTMVIVNTKTHERTRLKKGETAPNGLKLIDFKLGETRKETTVEVVLGSETTELKYNPEYMSQVASAGGGAAKQGPGAVTPGTQLAPGQRPAIMPGMNPGIQQQQQRGMPNGGQNIQLPSRIGPGARPAGVSSNAIQQQAVPTGVAMGGGNSINANVNGVNINLPAAPVQNPGGQGSGPLVSDVNSNAPAVPVRRRLISAPVNEQVQ